MLNKEIKWYMWCMYYPGTCMYEGTFIHCTSTVLVHVKRHMCVHTYMYVCMYVCMYGVSTVPGGASLGVYTVYGTVVPQEVVCAHYARAFFFFHFYVSVQNYLHLQHVCIHSYFILHVCTLLSFILFHT